MRYRLPGDPHIIEKLRCVVGNQFGNRLEFDHDATKHKEVRLEASRELFSFVEDGWFSFRLDFS